MARAFGTDAPEFFEFSIGKSKKVYRLPLAASLPATCALAFADIAAEEDGARQEKLGQELILSLLDKYCPGASSELTISALGEVLTAWIDASSSQGATLGE